MRSGKGAWALLPIGVFLVVYLGLGILLTTVFDIAMGFYSVPIVVAFLIAIGVACLQTKGCNGEGKLRIMAESVGDANIMTMLLIFLLAGIFVGVVGRSSAQSVAYFMLSFVPPQFAVCILFLISCFISTAMGTSVGTITLIVPIAVAVSDASGFDLALCVGTTVGGAMFGDNLSFISDTTIAACNGQGCAMKDKFRTNFAIVVPAALLTIVTIFLFSMQTEVGALQVGDYDLIQTIPYLLVLIGGICGINVFWLLIGGILVGSVVMLATGAYPFHILLSNMSSGVAGMAETVIVTILVAAMCGLIRRNGGFAVLLQGIRRVFRGKSGGQLGMGLLVGAMDIATANNTVAIVMANPIAKEIAAEYGISSRKAASILDTFSCIFQGILPYGAQMLVALSAVSGLEHSLTAFSVIPYLFYPFFLLISSLVFIFFIPERRKKQN